ncbi:MAG: Uma2 family endonuclease [Gemmatimonadetes bacterium]|nr:Uma2 family endonuclease [Gemmatimonadota bacterium]NIR77459.1 Uma2 family endonuclease [Gemmatimonadota bacterium]NIT85983.1 Uma2 family endonuclease [Gemmatimonadota bacterium]NIU29803.1 Uma2 family endonuclease [Gemmatimonadota bacterium]NIU34825.1 Uma2 family endonuclease [Gemmatimonadota bacterium]
MSVELQRRLFTVDEYHAMARAGVLNEDDRVELIEGEVVRMTPIGSRHAACVKRLIRLFSDRVGEEAILGIQDPVRLSGLSEPEPDVALLQPRDDFYEDGHPRPEDLLLLVEVSETSQAYDRDVKLPLYARSGVPEVWLVDLERGEVEVHRSPTGDGYADSERVGPGHALRPRSLPDAEFGVSEILG